MEAPSYFAWIFQSRYPARMLWRVDLALEDSTMLSARPACCVVRENRCENLHLLSEAQLKGYATCPAAETLQKTGLPSGRPLPAPVYMRLN